MCHLRKEAHSCLARVTHAKAPPMRNFLVILMLACASSPAFAETKCTYILKSERGRLEFSNLSTHSFPGDPDKVTVTRANGREKHCTYLLQDEGSYIECP